MEQKIADFLINTGLYGKGLSISKDNLEELMLFLEGEYKIDAYCLECDAKRIFTTVTKPKRKSIEAVMKVDLGTYSREDESDIEFNYDGYIAHTKQIAFDDLISNHPEVVKNFSCAKEASHNLTFCCRISKNSIIKYGQYPSLADLSNTKTKKYRKILGEKYSDFNRGIGLHSHGVGAGSLVYLRRIFEELIEEAHKKALKEPNWNEEDFPNKMNEKIRTLKNYLPEYLVQNRKIYGVLSKGIHEMPEELCNEIFPLVRYGIEFILDEKLESEERERKKKENSSLIEKLSSKLVNVSND